MFPAAPVIMTVGISVRFIGPSLICPVPKRLRQRDDPLSGSPADAIPPSVFGTFCSEWNLGFRCASPRDHGNCAPSRTLLGGRASDGGTYEFFGLYSRTDR